MKGSSAVTRSGPHCLTRNVNRNHNMKVTGKNGKVGVEVRLGKTSVRYVNDDADDGRK